MLLNRHVTIILNSFLNSGQTDLNHNVLLVNGARQVGKTTSIQNALNENKNNAVFCVNLETDLVIRNLIDQTESFEQLLFILKDKLGFSAKSKEVLFIDEAQESEKIGGYIRSFKEKTPNAKYILTGSSMTRLFRADQRVPVGRYVSLVVHPLSFEEFLFSSKREALIEQYKLLISDPYRHMPSVVHEELLKLVDIWLTVGGLPAVVVSYFQDNDYQLLRENIFLSQAEDFIRKSDMPNKADFIRALKGVSNHLGSVSKLTHMGDGGKKTANIADALKAWGLIYEIEQHGVSSSSKFFPKRYLYDLGVAQYLRNMPFAQISILDSLNLALRTELGGLFENATLLNILQKNSVERLSGWKKNSSESIEVDFVLRTSNLVFPIECKASLKTSPRSYASLRQYLNITKEQRAILVTAAPFKKVKEGEKEFYNIPIYMTGNIPDLVS